jgi:hypothetical protein
MNGQNFLSFGDENDINVKFTRGIPGLETLFASLSSRTILNPLMAIYAPVWKRIRIFPPSLCES